MIQMEMDFEQGWKEWKHEVNKICREAFMLDSDSMPDFLWRDAHDKGETAWNAVNDAVEYWVDDLPGIDDAWNEYIVKGIPH